MLSKKIKEIIRNVEKLYNHTVIEKMAKKHSFVRRKGKISAESFCKLCTFLGEDLCSAALSKLCSKLEANEKISISPQALSKRFNKDAVNFMMNVFNEMMKVQNEILSKNEPLLKSYFNRITIVDSTGFKLDDKHKDMYKGCSVKSSVKIQLQYDLLTGEFIHCEIKEGNIADASYIPALQNTILERGLTLKDLGYFKWNCTTILL
ncbi:IS4 family transposase [Clostridium arbusti]|uniref:IS4 family transposase n=1 Tax=Clostridium arbusti TaxID=1137848 RepID=UPI00028922FC|nr:IS4 family transposase [Clostridium arbusti]